jgi:hypothetical protein
VSAAQASAGLSEHGLLLSHIVGRPGGANPINVSQAFFVEAMHMGSAVSAAAVLDGHKVDCACQA